MTLLHDVSKQEINKHILNYLIIEGYESTSLKFAKEMGMNLEDVGDGEELKIQGQNQLDGGGDDDEKSSLIGLSSIKFRKQIKLLILRGEIQDAIASINLKYPELLERNQFLYFKLLLLNLTEMIKQNNIQQRDEEDNNEFILKIIKFAQDKLTNKAIKNPKFMEELELTMTLLLYSNHQSKQSTPVIKPSKTNYKTTTTTTTDSSPLPKKLNRLLEFKLRRDTADLVNKSILVNELSIIPEQMHINNNIINQDHNNEGNDDEDEDEDEIQRQQQELNNSLIDSNLKKLVKFWIWSENTISNEFQDDVNDLQLLKKFEL